MSMMDLIRKRRSVRTFDGKALKEEDVLRIMEAAGEAGNPFDIPISWKILDGKKEGLSSPVIVGTDTFIAGKLGRVPHAEEAFGYSFEQVVLFAESIGVGTTWIAGTMNRGAFERAMEVGEEEVMPCMSPLGYPAKKMAFRGMMMRKGVKADSRLPFGELFFEEDFGTSLTEEKSGRLKEALEAVRLAPSAVNKQPWRVVVTENAVHFYEKHSGGYVSGGGWDMQKIDMGIALCHFELVAKESGIDAALEVADPGISIGSDMEYIASYRIG